MDCQVVAREVSAAGASRERLTAAEKVSFACWQHASWQAKWFALRALRAIRSAGGHVSMMAMC